MWVQIAGRRLGGRDFAWLYSPYGIDVLRAPPDNQESKTFRGLAFKLLTDIVLPKNLVSRPSFAAPVWCWPDTGLWGVGARCGP